MYAYVKPLDGVEKALSLVFILFDHSAY